VSHPRRPFTLQALGLLLASVASLALAAPAAQAQSLKLRVIGTTDLHMHLLSWDYYQDRAVVEYGFARTATLIEAARAEVRNSLLVDNGDLLQGSPLGDVVARVKPLAAGQVHPAIALLNRFNYDAMALGNHEFNYGLDFLRRSIADARFPVLSANVVEATGPRRGQPAFQPTALLERRMVDEAGATHTLKIGVIGVVPPQIMLWDRQNLEGKVRALVILESAQRLVPEMRARGASRGSSRAWLGLNCEERGGEIRVLRVTQDGPADLAGVRPGDRILRIDDAEVSALESLWKTLWRNGAERDVLLTIRRDGEVQTITVHATDRMKTLRGPQGI